MSILFALMMVTVPAQAVDLENIKPSDHFLDATSYESYRASLDAMVEKGLMSEEEATQRMAMYLQYELAKQLQVDDGNGGGGW
jgi:hypothetical protein